MPKSSNSKGDCVQIDKDDVEKAIGSISLEPVQDQPSGSHVAQGLPVIHAAEHTSDPSSNTSVNTKSNKTISSVIGKRNVVQQHGNRQSIYPLLYNSTVVQEISDTTNHAYNPGPKAPFNLTNGASCDSSIRTSYTRSNTGQLPLVSPKFFSIELDNRHIDSEKDWPLMRADRRTMTMQSRPQHQDSGVEVRSNRYKQSLTDSIKKSMSFTSGVLAGTVRVHEIKGLTSAPRIKREAFDLSEAAELVRERTEISRQMSNVSLTHFPSPLLVAPLGLPGRVDKLTLVTFNVGMLRYRLGGVTWYQNPPFTKRRLNHIPVALQSCDADVIALQEVYEDYQASFISDKLRSVYPFVGRLYSGGCLALHNGLMLLSKFPIIRTQFHAFKNVTLLERFFASKGMLEIVVSVPGIGNVMFLNLHLASGAVDPESDSISNLRNDEIRQAMDVAQTAAQRFDIPILIGDMNTAPQVCSENYRTFVDNGWVDTFTEAKFRQFKPPEKRGDTSTLGDSTTDKRNFASDHKVATSNKNTNSSTHTCSTNDGLPPFNLQKSDLSQHGSTPSIPLNPKHNSSTTTTSDDSTPLHHHDSKSMRNHKQFRHHSLCEVDGNKGAHGDRRRQKTDITYCQRTSTNPSSTNPTSTNLPSAHRDDVARFVVDPHHNAAPMDVAIDISPPHDTPTHITKENCMDEFSQTPSHHNISPSVKKTSSSRPVLSSSIISSPFQQSRKPAMSRTAYQRLSDSDDDQSPPTSSEALVFGNSSKLPNPIIVRETHRRIEPLREESLLTSIQIDESEPFVDGDEEFTWNPRNPLNTIGPHKDCHGQRCDHIFLPTGVMSRNLRDVKPHRADIIFREPRVIVEGCCFSCFGSNAMLVTLSDHYGVRIELKRDDEELCCDESSDDDTYL